MFRHAWWCVVPLALAALACEGESPDFHEEHRRLRAETDAVEFPRTAPGTPVAAEVVLLNDGTGPTRVWARVEPEGAPVFLPRSDLAVGAGDREHLQVVFSPVSETDLDAVLVLVHDGEPAADGSTSLRLALRGVTLRAPDCDDHNPCTLDQPDPTTGAGCLHLPLANSCDDGNTCTEHDTCVAGTCTGVALECDDGISCTADHCDPLLGCVSEPTAQLCNDDDPCTVDSCAADAPVPGCMHVPAPTGTLCGAPSCAALPMCVAGQCVTVDTPDGFPCEDGDPCSTGDACNAGACVPGPGGQWALGAPSTVVDAQTAPDPNTFADPYWDPGLLFGAEPVDVAGAAWMDPVTDDDTGAFRVLWRGAQGGGWCRTQPSQCAVPMDPCMPIAVVRPSMDLHLTRVTPEGMAVSDTLFPAGVVYQRLESAMGVQRTTNEFVAPAWSVAAVRAIPVDGVLVGAAVINFGNTCETDCTTTGGAEPPPTPPQAQALACLPAGPALAVFTMDALGFHIVHARWLGASWPGTYAPAQALDPTGLPLLALAHRGTRVLAITAATEGSQCGAPDICDAENCGCGSAVLFTAHALNIPPNGSLAFGHERTTRVTFGWPGPEGNIRDLGAHVDAALEPVVTWRQRTGSPPPPYAACSYAAGDNEFTDLATATFSTTYQSPRIVAPLVRWASLMPDADGDARAAWSHVGRAGENACLADDVLQTWGDDDGPPTTVFERIGVDASLGVGAVDLARGIPGPVFVGADQRGHVFVTSSSGAFLSAGYPTDRASLLEPTMAPVVAVGPASMLVVAASQAGIWRDSLPTPTLSVMTLACGP